MQVKKLFVFLITINIINFSYSREELSTNEVYDQNKFNIIGTYQIGSGFAAMAKKKIIDEIKKKLSENYSYDGNEIVNKLVNLKGKSTDFYKVENLNIVVWLGTVSAYQKHQILFVFQE